MDDQNPGGPPPGEVEGGLSPVRAFLVLGAVLAAIAVWFLATRDATPASPSAQPSRSPDYSLTAAEAIARFHELHGLFRSASKNRDLSLLGAMLVTDSPLHAVARRQIRQLTADGVLDRSRFVEESVEVTDNSPARIEIEQVVIIRPRFVSASTGRVVSTGARLRQKVSWVLTVEETVWKVYDSQVLSSTELK